MSEEEKEIPGLKLTNKKSRVRQAREDEDLVGRASEIQEKFQARKQNAYALAAQFVEFLNDKTLPDNKGVIGKDLEKELIGKLVQFAIDTNNDPNEQYDGMGSVGIITLLLRALLIQRDKLNRLDYKLSKLEQKLSSQPEEKNDNK